MLATTNSSTLVFERQITGAGSIQVGLQEVTLNASVGAGQTLQFVFDALTT